MINVFVYLFLWFFFFCEILFIDEIIKYEFVKRVNKYFILKIFFKLENGRIDFFYVDVFIVYI